ncbi:7025_t:CDS:2 [Funneliformis mosseae]|uniref:7025_t:CDS:1 n=1 Tax=Funneliformis mosseae TaxID=27381 RepID=A0A9N8V7X1_FUNMO|nr:7025_t:CDS:2 [Funneliformis mosseae]
MASEFFPGLSQKFSQLLEDSDDYDIIIKVGVDPNTRKFHAHCNILRARSPYFKRALTQNLVTDENNFFNFTKPNISPTVFEMIIREETIGNLGDWNKKDFLALKNTLNQFIKHIRFFEISSNDFHSKIWPFRKVIPKSLFEDIVSFHMSNTESTQNKLAPRYNKIPIDSMIIKPKHAAILANWIQRKDSNARIPKDIDFTFNLIYRGSRDGYDINNIRSMCNGQGACILFIKIEENETLIGGYNPIGWKYNDINIYHRVKGRRGALGRSVAFSRFRGFRHRSRFDNSLNNYWANTIDSFIFSLGDGNNLKNFKISRVVNSKSAIYESNYQNIPLNFGNSDLVVNGNVGTCNQARYESQILDTNSFTIEEMEIFRFYKNE